MNQSQKNPFEKEVALKFQIYNSLFLGLPFHGTQTTGMHVPFLVESCERGLRDGLAPYQIIKNYLRDSFANLSEENQHEVLFNIIQYIERQVVLFDAIEDSAFDRLNDLTGAGTLNHFYQRIKLEKKQRELKTPLDNFRLHVVLTAHPTQFYPETVLHLLHDLQLAIRKNDLELINTLLIQLGKTPFVKRESPTALDEARSLIWYLENTFYSAVSETVDSIFQLCQQENFNFTNDSLITLGFWPGGDRDGNPNVSCDITRAVLLELSSAILRCYHRDLSLLHRRLTFSGCYEAIGLIAQKLQKSLYGTELSYKTSAELVKDLEDVRAILLSKHNGLFCGQLDSFIRKVRVFGLHFAGLDIRQDSRVISSAITEVLAESSSELTAPPAQCVTESDQIQALLKKRFDPKASEVKSKLAQDLVDVIKLIKWSQERSGPQSCERFIISNCSSALTVIQIFWLAKSLNGSCEIDIIPLFETVEDLNAAADIVNLLLSIPQYKKHLEHRHNKQIVMLGFSDGTKDGGYLTANWLIYRAKEQLTKVARDSGINLVFFDGRGGPPARGGGNTHKFYASLGETIARDEIQLTIQGQTISSTFGTTTAARYNLEQLLTAGLESKIFSSDERNLSSTGRKLIEELSASSLKKYSALKNHPDFIPYLQNVSPLEYYSQTNISSRPAKRAQKSELKLDDLRAIPFVGAWTQLKQNIPGYYGLGFALEDLQSHMVEFQKLYERNLFFRTLIDNSMQVLKKTRFDLTGYLKDVPEYADLWQDLEEEFKRTFSSLLKISSCNELLQNTPTIRSSIELREQIVLPLLVIQQYALQELRTSTDSEQTKTFLTLRSLIIRSMFGIINAGRNSV